MSEFTPESEPETAPFDFSNVDVEESADEIIVPQPDITGEDSAPDKPQSAAERVRARLRGTNRGGAAPTEPSGRREQPRPSRVRAAAPPKPREGSLVKPLTELYQSVGLMLAPIDPVCSIAFLENAETCAKSLETLARENETVRRAILALTQTSAWGGVLIAHLPLLLMVFMHHGPEEMRDRVAPLAAMTNPSAMKRAQDAQANAEDNAA